MDEDNLDGLLMLAVAFLLALVLWGCDDSITEPEDPCTPCYLVTLSDGRSVRATTINWCDRTWHVENACTGEKWAFTGLQVRIIGMLEQEGCE